MTSKQRIIIGAKNSAQIQKDRKKQRIVNYVQNPNKCKRCGIPLDYEKRRNKYCSKSCSASVSNAGVRRHGISPIVHPCKKCGEATTNKSFCSKDCQLSFPQVEIWRAIEKGTWNGDPKTLRKFLLANRGHQCEQCNRKKWRGQAIPLTVHHQDGNAINNVLNNLELLCWNCHALTNNFGRKNQSSSRVYRY